jgi:hypothetical protein
MIEDITRLLLYGARMDVFLVEKMDWRIGVIYECSPSRKSHPHFHGVASDKLDR